MFQVELVSPEDISYSGEAEDRKKSMDSLMAAFWVAIILIYMSLGALFR